MLLLLLSLVGCRNHHSEELDLVKLDRVTDLLTNSEEGKHGDDDQFEKIFDFLVSKHQKGSIYLPRKKMDSSRSSTKFKIAPKSYEIIETGDDQIKEDEKQTELSKSQYQKIERYMKKRKERKMAEKMLDKFMQEQKITPKTVKHLVQKEKKAKGYAKKCTTAAQKYKKSRKSHTKEVETPDVEKE